MLKDLTFYKNIQSGSFGLETSFAVSKGGLPAIYKPTGLIGAISGEMTDVPRFASPRARTARARAIQAHYGSRIGTDISVLSPMREVGGGLVYAAAPFAVVAAVELIDRFWVKTPQSVVVPAGYSQCATPSCGIGDNFIYYSVDGCLPLGSCPMNQGLAAPEPIGTQAMVAFKVVDHGGGRYDIGAQYAKAAGVTEPIRVGGGYTIPQMSLGATESVSPMEPGLAEPVAVERGLWDPAIEVTSAFGPGSLEFVDKGEDLQIVQSSGSGSGGRKPPEWMSEGFGVDSFRRPLTNREVEKLIRRKYKKHKNAPDKLPKTTMRKSFARAVKVYHQFTEVSDGIENVYATLPYAIRKTAKAKTAGEMMRVVWENIGEINVPMSILNMIYNHYEDKVVGRVYGKVGSMPGAVRTVAATGAANAGPEFMSLAGFKRGPGPLADVWKGFAASSKELTVKNLMQDF